MAKVKRPGKPGKKVKEKTLEFPLNKTNFLILGLGVLLIIVGYWFMALPDDPDAFLTRTLAPIVLVFAFLVVIPFGLMYRKK